MDTNGATTAVGNFNWIRVSTPNGLVDPAWSVPAAGHRPQRHRRLDDARSRRRRRFATRAPAGRRTSVTAVARLFPASDTGLASDFYQYEAHITRTVGGNEVHLRHLHGRCGRDTGTGYASRPRPATGNGTVRFIAFGDSGVGSTAQSQLAARMTADTFDLALHTGDVAYGTSDLRRRAELHAVRQLAVRRLCRGCDRIRSIRRSATTTTRSITRVRTAMCSCCRSRARRTTYPDNAERYYSFDYGPVHFVALDTEYALLDAGRQQAQLAWLDADLAATTQPWRVVYFHRSPYSSGSGAWIDPRRPAGVLADPRASRRSARALRTRSRLRAIDSVA